MTCWYMQETDGAVCITLTQRSGRVRTHQGDLTDEMRHEYIMMFIHLLGSLEPCLSLQARSAFQGARETLLTGTMWLLRCEKQMRKLDWIQQMSG